MDADGRFGVGSDEFIELAGPRTMATLGRLWSEIADELKLDPNSQVARAHATVADARREFNHQLSTQLIAENQGIAVEDLSVAGLARTDSALV